MWNVQQSFLGFSFITIKNSGTYNMLYIGHTCQMHMVCQNPNNTFSLLPLKNWWLLSKPAFYTSVILYIFWLSLFITVIYYYNLHIHNPWEWYRCNMQTDSFVIAYLVSWQYIAKSPIIGSQGYDMIKCWYSWRNMIFYPSWK